MFARRAGYTLVEILVVMAMLVLLVSLIVGIGPSLRSLSRRQTCVSNLHQISVSMQLYCADYDQAFPPAVDGVHANISEAGNHWISDGQPWTQKLLVYLKPGEVYECPKTFFPDWYTVNGTQYAQIRGYGYNNRLEIPIRLDARHYQGVGVRESNIAFPTLSVALFDARAGIISSRNPDVHSIPGDDQATLVEDAKERFSPERGAYRHDGGANYAFADGHIKWLRPSFIQAGKRADGLHPSFGL